MRRTMKTKTCIAIATVSLAINLGCFVDDSNAQQYYGYSHSGSCTGGCSHGSSNDSFVQGSYGQYERAMMRQYYPSQRNVEYSGKDMTRGRNSYAQPYQNRPPYSSGYSSGPRSAYRDYSMSQYDRRSRGNYETRREEFPYANDLASSFSSRGSYAHSGCRGGCSHGQRGGGFDSRQYEGKRQRSYEVQSPYRNEADRAPQLDGYHPNRGDKSAFYGKLRSDRMLQSRQEYANSQLPDRIGKTSQDSLSPIGPPPNSSFDTQNRSGSSGCGHAGCNHDHN